MKRLQERVSEIKNRSEITDRLGKLRKMSIIPALILLILFGFIVVRVWRV